MKIYYDGVCKLCTGFVSLTKRFSKKGTFVFIPLQEATIKIPENFSNTVIVETYEGKLFAYADAVSLVLKNMSFPFRIINMLLKIFPKSIRSKVYAMIAKNRYHWFGKHETCQIIEQV